MGCNTSAPENVHSPIAKDREPDGVVDAPQEGGDLVKPSSETTPPSCIAAVEVCSTPEGVAEGEISTAPIAITEPIPESLKEPEKMAKTAAVLPPKSSLQEHPPLEQNECCEDFDGIDEKGGRGTTGSPASGVDPHSTSFYQGTPSVVMNSESVDALEIKVHPEAVIASQGATGETPCGNSCPRESSPQEAPPSGTQATADTRRSRSRSPSAADRNANSKSPWRGSSTSPNMHQHNDHAHHLESSGSIGTTVRAESPTINRRVATVGVFSSATAPVHRPRSRRTSSSGGRQSQRQSSPKQSQITQSSASGGCGVGGQRGRKMQRKVGRGTTASSKSQPISVAAAVDRPSESGVCYRQSTALDAKHVGSENAVLPECGEPDASQDNVNSSVMLKQIWEEHVIDGQSFGGVDLVGWFASE